MKTAFAAAKAGNKAKLARLLGVSKSAVSMWGDELPPLQRYRLKELRPKWFAEAKRAETGPSSTVLA